MFPKWNAQRDAQKPAWVRIAGLLPTREPEGVLAPDTKLSVARRKTSRETLVTVPALAAGIRFPAPPVLQTASGANLQPIVTDAAGRIVLGRIGESALYVLADPDLLNNHGIADPAPRRRGAGDARLSQQYRRRGHLFRRDPERARQFRRARSS